MCLLVSLLAAAGDLAASTIISNCTLNAVATTCYASGTFSFADSLDWGAAVAASGQSGFGDALNPGNPDEQHNVNISPWAARSADNINIYATLGPSFSGDPLLSRVDNTYWGYGPVDVGGVFINRWQAVDDVVPSGDHLVTFAGHFGADPTSVDPYQLGDHLLGSIYGQGPIVLSFDQDLTRVGFQISSYSGTIDADFNATLIAYNGTTVLDTYYMEVQGGGGICDPLKPSSPNSAGDHPQACDDAAFIAVDAGPQRITSIAVITSDTSGFLIGGLLFQPASAGVEVPEPAVFLMAGGGLVALVLLAKKRARPAR